MVTVEFCAKPNKILKAETNYTLFSLYLQAEESKVPDILPMLYSCSYSQPAEQIFSQLLLPMGIILLWVVQTIIKEDK